MANLNVVFGAHGEESLYPSTAVFGALALKSVGQQHDKSAQPVPLVFGTGDELIDNDLGAVPEVAKLCFPDHQSVRTV